MTAYPAVYEFTPMGMSAFKRIFEGTLPEDAINPIDGQFAVRIPGTTSIDDSPCTTAKELAARVLASLGTEWSSYLTNSSMWAWLTFVLRDSVAPRDSHGHRRPGEVHRWYPSDPGDWQKAQRHLVRMPVILLGTLGTAADHLLCGPPWILPEIREQLTSQQDMFNVEFQKVARALYLDELKGGLKRGTGGKGAGAPRRLAKVRQQLDVTWNLFDLDADHIIKLLPKEFNRFMPAATGQ